MKSQTNWKKEYEKIKYIQHDYDQLKKNFKKIKEENKNLRYKLNKTGLINNIINEQDFLDKQLKEQINTPEL